MGTEIQQLLLSALTNLTKEYQKQSNEQIEREKVLINALELLKKDINSGDETYQNLLVNYNESMKVTKNLEFQVVILTEQNKKLNEQLVKLLNLLKK